jgi:O-antigen/teichoic acid export membrane protein
MAGVVFVVLLVLVVVGLLAGGAGGAGVAWALFFIAVFSGLCWLNWKKAHPKR